MSKSSKNAERVALLNDYDSEEDDFFLKGPSSSKDKIQSVQNQVREVVGVMKHNIEKVVERGDNLNELQDKSEDLADGAKNFNSRAVRLRKKMWWDNMKVKLFVAFILLILLIIIIVSATKSK